MVEPVKTTSKREVWIDNVKIYACVLVVLGHFLQSMISANILKTNDMFDWFEQSIYMFHVQLFFICSGYLYQKNSRVDSFNRWIGNISKKMVALGIPYLTFSVITWLLKTIFSDSVNTQVDGLFQNLFVNPLSPYWYLYCLFFLFLITPTFKDKKMAFGGLILALILKVVVIYGESGFYAVRSVMLHEIWFVIGMCLSIIEIKNFLRRRGAFLTGLGLMIIFLGGSIFVFLIKSKNELGMFVLGVVACIATILLFGVLFKDDVQNKYFAFLSKYTLPIFLMHTIFAATLRSVLLKLGIVNSIIHVILGLVISFVGPIIATEIIKKFKWMDFFLYPTKYIKINVRGNK